MLNLDAWDELQFLQDNNSKQVIRSSAEWLGCKNVGIFEWFCQFSDINLISFWIEKSTSHGVSTKSIARKDKWEKCVTLPSQWADYIYVYPDNFKTVNEVKRGALKYYLKVFCKKHFCTYLIWTLTPVNIKVWLCYFNNNPSPTSIASENNHSKQMKTSKTFDFHRGILYFCIAM